MNKEGIVQMFKHRSLTATAATFFFLLVGAAHADVAGSWKLAVGKNSCDLTLAADGTATGCADVAKWKATPAGLNLLTNYDALYGVLKVSGDTYAGNRVSDQRKITLSH
jgi:hypothetical protein